MQCAKVCKNDFDANFVSQILYVCDLCCFGRCTWHIDFTRCASRISIQGLGVSSFMFVTHFPCKLYLSHKFCKGLPEWFRCIMWRQILSACDFFCLQIVPITQISQRFARMISMHYVVPGPWCLWPFFLAGCTCHTDFAKVCQNDFDALCGARSLVLVTFFACKLYLSHIFCKGLPDWFRCIMWCQVLGACGAFSLQLVPGDAQKPSFIPHPNLFVLFL